MDFYAYDKHGRFLWAWFFPGMTENTSKKEVARAFERMGLKLPRWAQIRAVTCYGRVSRHTLL